MKSPRPEEDKKIEDNIIKYVRFIFRLQKEINDTEVKSIKRFFRLMNEN